MFQKSSLFVLVLIILQVSARYKSVEPDLIDNEINPSAYPESREVSSSSSRIVSGWEAQPGQHPHHAALHMVNSTGATRLCGGSIVSKEWIVTAAHCIIFCVLAIVRVGVVSISDSNPENIFLTTEWYSHPNFNNLSGVALQSHGVALVKLQRPLVYTELVKRIQLQSSADAHRDYGGQQVYVSGHGRTSAGGPISVELRWVYLRALSNSACQNAYTNGVFNTTICAQYFNVTSQSTCQDDLGGPLVHVDTDGVPTLIGVSYFFPGGGCDSGQPSGYYRPGAFLPWFKEVTGIDFENLQEEDENDTTKTTTTVPTDTTTPVPTDTTTPVPTDTTTPVPTDTTTPVPTDTTTPKTTTTSTTTTSITTDSEDQDLEEFTPEDNPTLPPKEEEEEGNPDGSQLSKRRTVNVNVKVLTNVKQL